MAGFKLLKLIWPKLKKRKLAKKEIGVLSEDVKMYMYLPDVNIYYALNDRTTNLLIKGNVDMSATTDPPGPSHSKDGFSDAEVREIARKEKEVELFTVETRAGGPFFPYLNITIFGLSKYSLFQRLDRNSYKHNCFYQVFEKDLIETIMFITVYRILNYRS